MIIFLRNGKIRVPFTSHPVRNQSSELGLGQLRAHLYSSDCCQLKLSSWTLFKLEELRTLPTSGSFHLCYSSLVHWDPPGIPPLILVDRNRKPGFLMPWRPAKAPKLRRTITECSGTQQTFTRQTHQTNPSKPCLTQLFREDW